MRFLLFIFIFSSQTFVEIKIEDLDYLRSLTSSNFVSIIENGSKTCNNYFQSNKFTFEDNKYENFFICKFSKERNRFYIYMLAVELNKKTSLKEFCNKVLESNPEVSDHMLKKFSFQKKAYLSGFYVDNFFNDKVMNFFNDFEKDKLIMNNEINNLIIQNRFKFTEDNIQNNKFIENEIKKANKIYKKIITNTESNLDKVIKSQLDKIVRYKIFINDIKKFKTYSCNWQPGKGLEPYVKREKFSEFENI